MSEPVAEERNSRTIDQRGPQKLESICHGDKAEVSNHLERQSRIPEPCRQGAKDKEERKSGRESQGQHHESATVRENAQGRSQISFWRRVAGT